MRIDCIITCIGLSCLMLLMTACGNRMLTHEVNEEVQTRKAQLDQVAAQFPQTAPLVEIIDGQYLGVKKVKLAEPLPAALQQGLILASVEPRTIEHITERITRLTQIPVTLAPDLYLLSAKPDNTDDYDDDNDATPLRAITYAHDGPLHLFLNNISGRLGITWRYAQGKLLFSRLITRVFQVHLLPGDTRFEASVGGHAKAGDAVLDGIGGGEQSTLSDVGGGDAGGGTDNDVNQVTQISSAPRKWDELTEIVQAMLSPLGKA